MLSEGCEESVVLQAIGVPRATYYRWKRNYKHRGLAGLLLEDGDKCPKRVRKATWTAEIENRVYHLRLKYRLFGKQKIAVMYERKYKIKIVQSTVGRIISKLLKSGKIFPVKFYLHGKRDTKKRVFNGHAQRWKPDMKPTKPGEYIEVDHATIYVPGHGQVKHFSAACQITKYAVYGIYQEATSKNASDFLAHMQNSFPFPVHSIQVDGGSEFRAYFELACQKAQIPLVVLPPRSPELNGHVEQSNGTAKYEFYAQYTGIPSLHLLRKNLNKFSLFYNFERPHQGIGLLTPSRFYEEMSKRPESHM